MARTVRVIAIALLMGMLALAGADVQRTTDATVADPLVPHCGPCP
jgi:hypothetical protein